MAASTSPSPSVFPTTPIASSANHIAPPPGLPPAPTADIPTLASPFKTHIVSAEMSSLLPVKSETTVDPSSFPSTTSTVPFPPNPQAHRQVHRSPEQSPNMLAFPSFNASSNQDLGPHSIHLPPPVPSSPHGTLPFAMQIHPRPANQLSHTPQERPSLLNSDRSVKDHPHLSAPLLYLDHVPSDLPESHLARLINSCLPVKIHLKHPVTNNARLKPDAYYDWMPKTGTMQFRSLLHTEKTLATLIAHPIFLQRGITISPYPPPLLYPLSSSPGRYLQPMKLVQQARDPSDSLWPTPGEVFDAARAWGAIRLVQVWLVEEKAGWSQGLLWGARVEFWYEDEAKRFEIGFGQTASLLHGWQVHISAERASTIDIPHPSIRPMTERAVDHPRLLPDPQPYQVNYVQPPFVAQPGPGLNHTGLYTLPPINTTQPLHAQPFAQLQIPFPDTPPHTSFTPPWASHNPFTIAHIDTPLPMSIPAAAFPISPPLGQGRHVSQPNSPITPSGRNQSRPKSHGSRGSFGSLRSLRERQWSVTLGEGPEGLLMATGLVGDDGTFISHGPGQHIRPAPAYGPGSTSSSGLVDYSNVFVKNLDPDINSHFLSAMFENMGKIISARVMRDDTGRSRGYGFVSFQTPEEANYAVTTMNGQKVGNQFISVTLHEPRKLRPEKIAERMAYQGATGTGRSAGSRRSSSPQRTAPFGGRYQNVSPNMVDTIRNLDPVDRQAALASFVMASVQAHAQHFGIPSAFVQPAVDALVSLDLSLVQLMNNPDLLMARIAEALSTLQGDPELAINNPASPPRVNLNRRATIAESTRIKKEVSRIDPFEVEEIMPILMGGLRGDEIDRCLRNKSFLAGKYNVAKKTLIRRQEQNESGPPLAGPNMTARPEEEEVIPVPPLTRRIPIETAAMDGLVVLPVKHLMANLEGAEGDALLTKLELSRPTAQALSGMEAWWDKIKGKYPAERQSEVISMISKRIDVEMMKRSQKAKVARDLVYAENDDEPLCQMALYPEILEGKLRKLMNEPKTSALVD